MAVNLAPRFKFIDVLNSALRRSANIACGNISPPEILVLKRKYLTNNNF
jgi:hypothetical protein